MHDGIDHDDEGASRSCNLHARAPQERHHNASHDRGKESRLWAQARGHGKGHGQGQGHKAHTHACPHVLPQVVPTVVLKAREGAGFEGVEFQGRGEFNEFSCQAWHLAMG